MKFLYANLFLIPVTILAIFFPNSAFSDLKPDKDIAIIVYRGVQEETPENTMAAFKRSVELGATGLMVDVRCTKDKKLVLMQDETIDRTTDGKGRVDLLMYDELRLYDAGSWRDKQFKYEKAPLLSEVLAFCKANELKLILDVKQFGIEKYIIALVKKYDMMERVYFWGALRNIKQLEPNLPINSLISVKYDEITLDMRSYAHVEHNYIITRMINSDDRELLINSINKKADIIALNYPQLIMDVFHTEEFKKIIEPDPLDLMEMQLAKSDKDKDSPPSKKESENLPHDTIFIRDEPSTLAEVIQAEDNDDSRMAALAMTGLLNEDTLPVLINLSESRKSYVRQNASWALGLLADKTGLQPLTKLLDDKDDEVRREAILAIKRLSNSCPLNSEEKEIITSKLINILTRDKNRDVRFDAARTIGDMEQGQEETITKLINVLQNDSDWKVKSACVGALGRTGDKSVVGPLSKILVSDSQVDASWTRNHAAWALAEVGIDAINSLVAALDDNEDTTRRRARWALANIGRSAAPALILALKDSNKSVRESAALTLGWIMDDYAVKALIWSLKDNDPDVKKAAAWALGRLGNKNALEPLQKAGKDKSQTVKKIVKEAINRIESKNE